MEISIAQNVAGQIQKLLQISCICFANWFAFLLHFCVLVLAKKMDLHFLHFFCILIFGGPFFNCFLLFSRKRQQPDHTTVVR